MLPNRVAHEAKIELDGDYRDLLTGEPRSGTLMLDAFVVAVLAV